MLVSRTRSWIGFVATLVSLLWADAARAEDPTRVRWSPDWPRVRLAEVMSVVGLTAASLAMEAYWTPPDHPGWQGGILFDDWVRDNLRGSSYKAQSNASHLSDLLYSGAVFAPYVVDVYFVALGIHQNADVAMQMLLIDLQSLGVTGVVTIAAERLVGRARPYTQDCGRDGMIRSPSGEVLYNACSGGGGDFQSFYSGHAAATATSAGLTCVHHQHLPLYGGGFADLVPCLVMSGVSLVTGVSRIVADRHWSSDVIFGWGVGAFSGYVLPSLLHYGFGGRPVGEVRLGGARAVPILQAYPAGAGIALAGVLP
jgi:membrane-associated phospholipid phosphatase